MTKRPREDAEERFVQHVAENQNRLFGYIYSLLSDHSRASDVLQETNLVLWRKRSEFDDCRPFLPWAFAIARMQVLASLRDRRKSPALLDVELAETLAADVADLADDIEQRQQALRVCLGKLSAANLELIQQRYFREMSIQKLADRSQRGASAIKVSLLRIRRKLSQCIERQLNEVAS